MATLEEILAAQPIDPSKPQNVVDAGGNVVKTLEPAQVPGESGFLAELDAVLGAPAGPQTPPPAAGESDFLNQLDSIIEGGPEPQKNSEILEAAGKLGTAVADSAATVADTAVDFLPDIGGAVGFAITSPIPIPGIRVAGAAIGGMVGEGGRAMIRDEDITGRSLATQAVVQPVSEVTGEKLARAGIKLATRTGRAKRLGFLRSKFFGTPLAGDVFIGINESNEFVKGLAKDLYSQLIAKGMTADQAHKLTQQAFLPSEVSSKRLLRELEGVADASLTNTDIETFRRNRELLLQEGIRSYLDTFGEFVDPETAADVLQKRLRDVLNPIGDEIGALHNAVSATLKDAGPQFDSVDLGPVQDTLARQRGFVERFGDSDLDPEGVASIVEALDRLPVRGTFEDVKQWRTNLNTKLKNVSPGTRNNLRGAVSEVKNSVTDQMRATLKAYDEAHGLKGGESLVKAWEDANTKTLKFHNEQKTVFVEQFLDMVENKGMGTEAVSKVLRLRGKRLKRLKTTLRSNSKAWRSFQRLQLQNLVGTREGGAVKGASFLERLTGPRGFGRKNLEELYGKEMAGKFVKLGEAMEFAKKGTGAKSDFGVTIAEAGGKIALASAGGLFVIGQTEAATATAVGGGTTLLGLKMGSGLAVRLLMDPKVLDAVIRGTRESLTAREIGALVPRIMAHATSEDEIAVVPPSRVRAEREAIERLGRSTTTTTPPIPTSGPATGLTS